ncbi:hypothetical protein [Acrocarpospora catenulata]|uniref:hypothetical protein n=1 Tax=Acrocarpospora catenulata TaxID=2836182 RepID=UPI001BDA66C8|nr:hypothetical protein [Acrocarpospora catenulata]
MAAKRIDAVPGFPAAQAVADAILYEGYLLYPYRRSSVKNRVRWQFGVLLPEPWAKAQRLDELVGTGVAGSAESWWQQTECLVKAGTDATVHCRLRFLRLRRRTVEKRLPDGTHREVDQVEAGDRMLLGFDEAVPKEFDFQVSIGELLEGERRFDIQIAGSEEMESFTEGRIRRKGWPLKASLVISAVICDAPSLVRLRVRVENLGKQADTTRDEALRHALIASHLLLAVPDGCFVSLLEPPDWAEAAARDCSNVRTFPVLAGEVVLSSPILLYDHPQVAPESPGDLHDAAEIDEILSLRTLTLTDAEKREARATDQRAAAILDRVETMPPEVLTRLHGVARTVQPATLTAPAWWSPEADAAVAPEHNSIVVSGKPLRRGSRVRLRPRLRGSDPQDMFLDGRTARVEAVLLDVDGAYHLAVTLEDDPGADLNQWYGRFRYFAPDEVEPLPGNDETEGDQE